MHLHELFMSSSLLCDFLVRCIFIFHLHEALHNTAPQPTGWDFLIRFGDLVSIVGREIQSVAFLISQPSSRLCVFLCLWLCCMLYAVCACGFSYCRTRLYLLYYSDFTVLGGLALWAMGTSNRHEFTHDAAAHL